MKTNMLATPVPMIDIKKLKNNINKMANLARESNTNLRPMVKTHKSPQIAKMQLDAGANGVTVATLDEAEVMVESGIKDIFIAYEIIGNVRLRRLLNLNKKANISVAIDSLAGAKQLASLLNKKGQKMEYLIEIDSGLHRCGVQPGEPALNLAQKINNLSDRLILKGIFTHAGQVYGATSMEKVKEIGEHEGEVMARTARLFREKGIELKVVSVGSTPTVPYSAYTPEVNEIRPGNYIFYDNIQIGLGVISPDEAALTVESMVISRPSCERVIIDAGSKSLAQDKGAHGVNLVKGFGLVLIDGLPRRDIIIDHLSEEHGFLLLKKPEIELEVGDRIEIIPNHACAVANLFDSLVLKDNQNIMGYIDVVARRKIKTDGDD